MLTAFIHSFIETQSRTYKKIHVSV